MTAGNKTLHLIFLWIIKRGTFSHLHTAVPSENEIITLYLAFCWLFLHELILNRKIYNHNINDVFVETYVFAVFIS